MFLYLRDFDFLFFFLFGFLPQVESLGGEISCAGLRRKLIPKKSRWCRKTLGEDNRQNNTKNQSRNTMGLINIYANKDNEIIIMIDM